MAEAVRGKKVVTYAVIGCEYEVRGAIGNDLHL